MTMISKPAFGRLVSVELREAWQGESTDFTPWPAQPENIKLLGEAIGVELEAGLAATAKRKGEPDLRSAAKHTVEERDLAGTE